MMTAIRVVAAGIALLLLSERGAVGYSTGAPEAACSDMKPHHGVEPQASAPPYSIKVSTSDAKFGEEVTVTLSGPHFVGFMIQAQEEEDNSKVRGTFQTAPNTQYTKCQPNPQGGLTHTGDFSSVSDHSQTDVHLPEHELEDNHSATTPSGQDGNQDPGLHEQIDNEHHNETHTQAPGRSVTFKWTAHSTEEHIVFRATVVEHKTVFWTDVTSETVHVHSGATAAVAGIGSVLVSLLLVRLV